MATSVDQKLLRHTKFPVEFSQKVDMQKVNVEVMKKWIAGKISEILGSEDDVVIELCFNLLEGSRYPNIKVLQIQLTGFLENDTAAFCKDLWTLCLSAQSNLQGVPKELLEAKKLELIQEKIETEKAAEASRQRQDQERARDREMENSRRDQSGRGDRVRGRGRDVRDTRGRGTFDSRGFRKSRSPPRPRPNSSDYRVTSMRREVDTYIPSDSSRGQERRDRRARFPSNSTSRSTSRTPPRKLQRRSRTRSHSRSPNPQKIRVRSSRSPSNDRTRRGRDTACNRRGGNRGDDRARSDLIEASRSRSPRVIRPRMRSASSSPRSPIAAKPEKRKECQQTLIRRSPSRSRSPRSPLPRSNLNLRDNASKGDKVRLLDRGGPHDSGRSVSGSLARLSKRRRSLERYDPKAKRRRNSSSVEHDESSVEREATSGTNNRGE